MAQHSSIVGGSTAKRVISCPGSVALVQQMPPKPSSKYADEGTLLHNVIAEILTTDRAPESYLGTVYEGITLDQDLIDAKLRPALDALNDIDPDKTMEYAVEQVVGFGDLLPGVFGSADLIGRRGDRAIVLDWKFGSGVAVDVEENAQAMFYAAAAMRTPETAWAFEGATEIECIIVQPPSVKRWVTTFDRIAQFERELLIAVKAAQLPDAPLSSGDHCRWCAAKPTCPLMTGAVDRALKIKLHAIDAAQIGVYLKQAELLEAWISGVNELAYQMLDEGLSVPGYKLVPKRSTRKWIDDEVALSALERLGLDAKELVETSVVSPAKAEKLLKKQKIALPATLVVSISTGNTLATEDDPRPAVMQIGKQLASALGKLV
jgi:hypothetical protein